MPIEFTKMHGIGNDFIVINALDEPLGLSTEEIRRLSHRRFGIGFDQLLVVEPPTCDEAEFNYRIFNADGGEVENCGNGARCFARYVTDKALTSSAQIPVMTSTGLMTLTVCENGLVTVSMDTPVFEPAQIPFDADRVSASYAIEVAGEQIEAGAVAVGNPHVVLQVASSDQADVERLGPLLESHHRFPNRVNAGFMQVDSRSEIHLRVFERGVGETLACGTGACAAVAVGIRQGVLNREVTVHLRGGDLQVQWADDTAPVLMTGPGETVFEGRLE
jgi:diaminopimelate epimerase